MTESLREFRPLFGSNAWSDVWFNFHWYWLSVRGYVG